MYINTYIAAKDGYQMLAEPGRKGRKISVQRYMMQEHLGKELTPNEIVHHKNEDKLDNRLENLEVLTRSEHAKLHRLGDKGRRASPAEARRMARLCHKKHPMTTERSQEMLKARWGK